MYKEAVVVFPSGEWEIKGREGHFLFQLGGEIVEIKWITQEEELLCLKDKGGWGVSLQVERGKVSGI